MRRIVCASTVLALFTLAASARLGQAGQPPTLTNFETICLKSNSLCRYIELDFSPSGQVASNEVVYLPVSSPAASTFWNQHLKLRAHMSQTVEVAVYNTDSHSWTPVPMDKRCPWCVPKSLLRNNEKEWVRFKSKRTSAWKLANSAWSLKRVIGRGQHSNLYVRVNSPNGPIVYASARNSGMHYHYSTERTGNFGILLESGWVPSARPDYLIISPVRSWSLFASTYMRHEAAAMRGMDRLPRFKGSPSEVIDQAIRYIASQDIRYDDTVNVGGYPKETVTTILAAREADCKGFTTLLYALLRKSGITSQPMLFNAFGVPPLSFDVPGTWPNHVMLYVPQIRKYIDITVSLFSHGEYTWRSSADAYEGDLGLDLATGTFMVVR